MSTLSIKNDPAAGITPRNGMYVDKMGFMRFLSPGTAMTPDGKRWYVGTIVRKIVDSHGEVIRKVKQEAEVFSLVKDAIAMLFKRCPDPFAGTAIEGELKVSIEYGERQ